MLEVDFELDNGVKIVREGKFVLFNQALKFFFCKLRVNFDFYVELDVMIWNEGYVLEVNYIYGFYGELSFFKLVLVNILKLLKFFNLEKNFNYCELVCG